MLVSKDMTIGELIRTYSKAAAILMAFGMGCVSCPSAQGETLEQAADVHGIDINELMDTLTKELVK